jgi:hypothetical protein
MPSYSPPFPSCCAKSNTQTPNSIFLQQLLGVHVYTHVLCWVRPCMQESSAPQSALSSPMITSAEQHGSSSVQASRNMPAGCTQVPITIVMFHRPLTGRGSGPQLPPSHSFAPAPALPDASEGKHGLILFFPSSMLVQLCGWIIIHYELLNAFYLLFLYIF